MSTEITANFIKQYQEGLAMLTGEPIATEAYRPVSVPVRPEAWREGYELARQDTRRFGLIAIAIVLSVAGLLEWVI